jgi:hypothetical protein
MEIPGRFPLSSFLVALFRGNRASAAHQLEIAGTVKSTLEGQPAAGSRPCLRLFAAPFQARDDTCLPRCSHLRRDAGGPVRAGDPGHGISLSSDKASALHASAFSDGGRRAVGAGLDWTWDLEFCAATFARKRDSYTRRAASLGFGVWSFGVLAFGIWNFPSSSAGAPYSQRSTAVTSPGLAARNAV